MALAKISLNCPVVDREVPLGEPMSPFAGEQTESRMTTDATAFKVGSPPFSFQMPQALRNHSSGRQRTLLPDCALWVRPIELPDCDTSR
jgi:hypothetical protein